MTKRSNDAGPLVTADAEGVRCDIVSIPWTDIDRVEAYKLDHFTIDTVCVAVTFGEQVLTINEDVKGFWDTMDAMAQHLPTFLIDWKEAVLSPAFAENRTTLYERY